MKCADCKFWEAPKKGEWGPIRTVFGHCSRTPHDEDITEWDHETGERSVLPEYADRTACAVDGSGYHAALLTMPGHFCAMFAPPPADWPVEEQIARAMGGTDA
jgi:hypothetical protein